MLDDVLFLAALFGTLSDDEFEKLLKKAQDEAAEELAAEEGEHSSQMTIKRYQDAAYRNIQDHYNEKEEILHWAVGLGEEAGEVLSVVKHRYYGGHYTNNGDMLEDIVGELGDTMWYIAALCGALNISMEDVARYNIAKLSNRYPDDKFDFDRSKQRHEIFKEFKETKEHDLIMAKIRRDAGSKTKV